MTTPWDCFKQAVRLEEPVQVPVAFIVDSPWLPGYARINTLDYFLLPDQWLEINLRLLDRFPEAVWVPGFWVEYAMAAEPSAFGARISFHTDRPPSVEPLVTAGWLMGNVPSLDVAVRKPPEVVAQWARECLDKAAPGGGMILSVGGGVSPDTPPESLDAMLAAARAWSKPR